MKVSFRIYKECLKCNEKASQNTTQDFLDWVAEQSKMDVIIWELRSCPRCLGKLHRCRAKSGYTEAWECERCSWSIHKG